MRASFLRSTRNYLINNEESWGNLRLGGWKLDTLIHAVQPGAITPETLRNRRRELRLATSAFATIGIEVKDDRMRRLAPSRIASAQP